MGWANTPAVAAQVVEVEALRDRPAVLNVERTVRQPRAMKLHAQLAVSIAPQSPQPPPAVILGDLVVREIVDARRAGLTPPKPTSVVPLAHVPSQPAGDAFVVIHRTSHTATLTHPTRK